MFIMASTRDIKFLLSDRTYVVLSLYLDVTYVHIRNYTSDGKYPTKQGVCMSSLEFQRLMDFFEEDLPRPVTAVGSFIVRRLVDGAKKIIKTTNATSIDISKEAYMQLRARLVGLCILCNVFSKNYLSVLWHYNRS